MTVHGDDHDDVEDVEDVGDVGDVDGTLIDLPPGFRQLYAGCERSPHRDRPWVMANMVMGLDGSATLNGRAGDLSDPVDQRLFAFLRTLADAVVVGAQTVRVEEYGAVTAAQGRAPRMVIVTASGQLDFDSPLFTGSTQRPLIVTTAVMIDSIAAAAGPQPEVIAAGEQVVDIVEMLRALRRMGIECVLTEGGPTLLSELVRTRTLDELCITIAPIFGGGQRLVFENAPAGGALTLVHSVPHDDHLFCRYLCR